jgi:hypothetical protein
VGRCRRRERRMNKNKESREERIEKIKRETILKESKITTEEIVTHAQSLKKTLEWLKDK